MTGWQRKTWPASRVGAGLISMMIIGSTGAAETAEIQPSLEMLEFLLEWDSADGQWHDPAELDPDAWQVHEQEAAPEPAGEPGS